MRNKIFKLIFFCFFVINFQKIQAQDIIILLSGDEIQSVVKEVGIDIIKYNKFDNQNGPIYSIEKSKVFMIKYQNGTKDIISQQKQPANQPKEPIKDTVSVAPKLSKPIPQYMTYSWGSYRVNNNLIQPAEVQRLFSNYPEAYSKYQTGKAWHIGASCMSWSEIGMLFLTGYAINNLQGTQTKESVTRRGLSIIGGMMVIGVSCNIIGTQYKKGAVESYNNALRAKYNQ